MRIPFTKMTSGGNDFILLDGIGTDFPSEIGTAIPALCQRRFGIGADGLIIISPSSRVDCEMEYFNADGSRAALCGNGARCVALYMRDGYHRRKNEIRLECDSRTYSSTIDGEEVLLTLPDTFTVEKPLEITGRHISLILYPVKVAVPHGVIFFSDISKLDVNALGKLLQGRKDLFPEGVNVNFVKVETLVGPRTISLRTYERGVESETLCCGTGAIAAALVSCSAQEMHSPVEIRTRGREILQVGFTPENHAFHTVWLKGKARKVYEGSLDFPLEV
jgi:diaminopimelate epimerase